MKLLITNKLTSDRAVQFISLFYKKKDVKTSQKTIAATASDDRSEGPWHPVRLRADHKHFRHSPTEAPARGRKEGKLREIREKREEKRDKCVGRKHKTEGNKRERERKGIKVWEESGKLRKIKGTQKGRKREARGKTEGNKREESLKQEGKLMEIKGKREGKLREIKGKREGKLREIKGN